MAQLIKCKSTVNTQNQECTIHIVLDLNVNLTNNEISVNVNDNLTTNNSNKDVELEIPTFIKSNPGFKFGKKVE